MEYRTWAFCKVKGGINYEWNSKRNFNQCSNFNNLGNGNYSKIGKGDAMRICGEHGIAFSNNYITFANLGGVNGKYGANVRLVYLKQVSVTVQKFLAILANRL